MDEADQLCDHVGIIDHGHVIALDTPTQLKKMVPGGSRLELQLSTGEAWLRQAFLNGARTIPGVEHAELIEAGEDAPRHGESTTRIRIYAAEQDINEELLLLARRVGVRIREIRLAEPSLESLFIYLTGRELRS
jgi:ABC-2 type transport system ATP-binding protein